MSCGRNICTGSSGSAFRWLANGSSPSTAHGRKSV